MTASGTTLDRGLLSALLEPASGLVRSYDLVRLPPPVPMHAMAIDIGTRFSRTTEPTAHDRVGAVDLTPAGALVRGTGEAVERYALAPQGDEPLPHLDGSRRHLTGAGLTCLEPSAWPGLPHPLQDEATRWYRGTDAATGAETWLPATVVDWPAPATAPGWEGTPSGAAAHTGYDAAVDAAVREVLERDALMTAWLRADRGGAELLDLAPLRTLDPRLERLTRPRSGFRLGAARLPAAVGHAYVAWVDDGRALAVGAGLDADEAAGVLTALREAWQIYAVLSSWTPAESLTPGFVAGAEARCAYWSDGRGRAEFTEWLAPLTPAAPHAPRAPGDLAGQLAAQGRSVVVVDLTARLPEAVRGAGFQAVKVLVRGLQPLIMLDDEPWSAVAGRVGPEPRAGAGPHPLI